MRETICCLVEYCFQCKDFPCGRYQGEEEYDSFITHRNRMRDLEKMREAGAEAYGAEQKERVRILHDFLDHYNDGRRKNLYCLAANLLELEEKRSGETKMFDIDSWIREYLIRLKALFGARIWFAGLQGSFGRGEATENSDIDMVVILDTAAPEDIQRYSKMLDGLPERERACGFLSGKSELLAWEPSDLFQFYFDTKPLLGTLTELREKISDEDIQRAIRIGACNVYHMCVHNMVHEKNAEILKGLYKSAAFTLYAIGYSRSGGYEPDKERLLLQLPPRDQEILRYSQELKHKGQISSDEFDVLSGKLLAWASNWILQTQEALS